VCLININYRENKLVDNVRNCLPPLILVLIAFIVGCEDSQQQSFQPNITLPTGYPGFSLAGKRPDGGTFEVLVGLQADDQRLVLKNCQIITKFVG
jgi:hypothetical protein